MADGERLREDLLNGWTQVCTRGQAVIELSKSIAVRVNAIRLRAALDEAHRARLAFLREDFFDGDCDRCARKVRDAEARAARLEAALRETRTH